jgi:CMP-N-acetylneuraminic acid synthetase
MLEYFNKVVHHPDSRVLLVQVTNPFLRPPHIKEAVSKLPEFDTLTVTEDHKFIWDAEGSANYDPSERPRRQDWAGIYLENGALYGTTVSRLLESECRISAPLSLTLMRGKWTQLEIDTIEDLHLAEVILRKDSAWLNKLKFRLNRV